MKQVFILIFMLTNASAFGATFFYKDHSGKTETATLKHNVWTRGYTLILSDFDKPISLPVLRKDELGENEVGNENIENVTSKSNSSIRLFTAYLRIGQPVVKAVRQSAREMFEAGQTKITDDQFCPKNSVGVLTLGIRDLGFRHYCLTADPASIENMLYLSPL